MLRYVSFTVTSASQLCPLPRQYPDFSLPLTQSGTSSSLSSSLPPSLSSPNSKPPSNHPPESTVLFRGHSTISLVSQGQLLRSSFDRTGLSVLILQRRKQSFCPGTLNQEVINLIAGFFPAFCTNSTGTQATFKASQTRRCQTQRRTFNSGPLFQKVVQGPTAPEPLRASSWCRFPGLTTASGQRSCGFGPLKILKHQ